MEQESSTPQILLNSTEILEHRLRFSWYDYGLFTAMLGLSALIGIYFGCFGTKQSTTGEYLLGEKSMKIIPVVISLVSSHVSGITLLGMPAEVYSFGASLSLMPICMFLVALLMAFVYLPVFFKLEVTSTYEYLELRFDAKTRTFGSMLFAIFLVFYLPVVIYIPALALATATGINLHLITIIMCGVCIFYTTIGGLKAVVWTDTLQFTITIGAVIVIFYLGVSSIGGLGYVFEKANEGYRLNVFDMDPSPFKRDSFWIMIFGTTVQWLSTTGANQGCIQKFLSIPTLKDAIIVVFLYGLGVGVLNLLTVITGLIMYAKYSDCDPFTTGAVSRNDELLPHYVIDVAGNVPGLSGLFIAGVVSAGLSTLSAFLNCLSGTIYEDFIVKFMPAGTSEKSASNTLKLIVAVTGTLCTLLVFVVEHMGGIFALSVAFCSLTAGPMLALFTLGMLFPRVNSKGALWGGIVAQILMFFLVIMVQYYKYIGALNQKPQFLSTDGCETSFNRTTTLNALKAATESPPEPFILFKLSQYLYTLLGAFLAMVFGYIISCCTEGNKNLRRELYSPLVHFLLPPEQKGPNFAEYAMVATEFNTSFQSAKKIEIEEM